MNYKQTIYLHIFTTIFILLGSLETVSNGLFKTSILGRIPTQIRNILLILIGISGIYYLIRKHTFLPFLGHNVLPLSLLKEKTPMQESTKPEDLLYVTVKVPKDNQYDSVIYWASGSEEPGNTLVKPWNLAYGDFENSGTEKINGKNQAVLSFKCPSKYSVKTFTGMKILPKHIHYRFVSREGMMSEIYTQKIEC